MGSDSGKGSKHELSKTRRDSSSELFESLHQTGNGALSRRGTGTSKERRQARFLGWRTLVGLGLLMLIARSFSVQRKLAANLDIPSYYGSFQEIVSDVVGADLAEDLFYASGTQESAADAEGSSGAGDDAALRFGFDRSQYQEIWDQIDNYDEAERCKRYGFGYSGRERSERRRVFYGALIADDSSEVLLASAAEISGIFHTVAFIESNTTQSRTLRTVRHGWGGEGMDFLQSGIYGPDTRVHVDMYYDGPDEGAMYLTREHLQRELITERWIQNGMTTHDLGYLADTDETFSRDFLRALQICEVREFQEPQTCRNAKIFGATLVFEGSPECITKDRRWFHPDVVMGYCIEGVGNSTGRLVALREYQNVRGRRQQESRNFEKGVDNVPLFRAPDIRQFGEGSNSPRLAGKDALWRDVPAKETHRATAYHFHNFFEDGEVVRHKYRTYGHPHKKAYELPLESLHNDLKLMVQCVRNIQEHVNDTLKRERDGFETLVGPRPIYYQIKENRDRRHQKIRSVILTDEETYGSEYPKERTDELVRDADAADGEEAPAKPGNEAAGAEVSEKPQPPPGEVPTTETPQRYDAGRYAKMRDEIDSDNEEERCKRYGFAYDPSRTDRRRIFFGSLIANEALDVLEAFATETYDIFHTVAFIESNTTQTRTERSMRYFEGSERLEFLQGLYGPSTKVSVDMYFDSKDPGATLLLREWLQREPILDRWIQNGMKADDLGIVSDTDETFSRDFLRALQICDVEQFRPDQDCRSPKLIGSTMVFEGSPECIWDERRWYHPDVIIGDCLEGVGDSTGHPSVERGWQGTRGMRDRKWKEKMPKDLKSFPLWNAVETRSLDGGKQVALNGAQGTYKGRAASETHRATAYHFHNFFSDAETLRRKYLTYGHPDKDALTKHISELGRDLKLFVSCMRNMELPSGDRWVQGGFQAMAELGPMPLYFQDNSYREWKHHEMKMIVKNDEAQHGTDTSFLESAKPREGPKEERTTPEREEASQSGSDEVIVETEDDDSVDDETDKPYNPDNYASIRNTIDNEDEEERCKRYGFAYDPSLRNRENRRRIFFGSLIADEPLDVLEAFATETYDMLHTVAFIESDTTQTRTPRRIRYDEGSERLKYLKEGLYGPNTQVTVDMYSDKEDKGAMNLMREWLQREPILDRWIKNGMRPDDLGIVSDADETFSRDFLRALQVCDVEEFRPGQDCKEPKILGSTMVFEGTPECITENRRWFHPDIMIGECLLGVGDAEGHPGIAREWKETRAMRSKKWLDTFPKDEKNYPLWNAVELRSLAGGNMKAMKGADGTYRGKPAKETHQASAYHFHNFFKDGATLRHKYLTYGHPNRMADKVQMDKLGADLVFFVKCIHKLDDKGDSRERVEGGFDVMEKMGPMPIYFYDESYRKWKHARMERIVAEDEKIHGFSFADMPVRTDPATTPDVDGEIATTGTSGAGDAARTEIDIAADKDALLHYDPSSFASVRQEVDDDDEGERCKRYGFEYDGSRKKESRRRIFYGSLLADEPTEVLLAFASETYDILHTVAFVESNTTQTRTPRTMRYGPNSEGLEMLQSGIYGSSTKVTVDLYFDSTDEDAKYLVREHLQREPILTRFIENGIRPDDLGIVADTDETFSRDFLRALQICDIEEFRPGQDCQHPKIIGSTIVFEGSPECVTAERRWFHPDIIVGECLQGVGDSSVHPIAVREWQGTRGRRENEWKPDGFEPKDGSKFPLWNAVDVRQLSGGRQVGMKGDGGTYKGVPVTETHMATGFHFHNFFTDSVTIRHKYLTYGHPNKMANELKLSQLGDDLKVVVKCVKDVYDGDDKRRRVPGGYDAMVGPMPMYFQNAEYRKQKHERMKQIILDDEKIHGSEFS